MDAIEAFLQERYYHQGEDWDGLCKRVASLGKDKTERRRIRNMIQSKRGIPSTPILMNAGRDRPFMSACSFIPIPDDLAGIMDAIKTMALIQKQGGGTGFNFSGLRPNGDIVQGTGGVASGPVSFMFGFNAVADMVKQGGKRRGANMGLMNTNHPDILAFVRCKSTLGVLKNFNISVEADETLLDTVEHQIPLINPRTNEATGHITNHKLLHEIAFQIWDTGEPGVIFKDNIEAGNPTPHLGEFDGINPCGEVPLYDYESCVLGSVNLYAHIKDGEMDWEALDESVSTMAILLNRVIDNNVPPVPEMSEALTRTRRIGLGLMGFADVLFRFGIIYGSEKCINLIHSIMSFINETAWRQSEMLAMKEGVTPAWTEGMPILRNASLLSIAPTGSISRIADVSSGMEPVFALSYSLDREQGTEIVVTCRAMRDMGLESPAPWMRVSREISPEDHIKTQASFQAHIDQAISKTVNLQTETSVEDIKYYLRLAHASGLKGVTMFREGCRREGFLKASCVECDEGACVIDDTRRETSETI
jgi:ribonucleoside-diphosphate reductase alpha chain